MQLFYHPIRVQQGGNKNVSELPAILGLTASPIYGGDVEKAFQKIENNLDSTIRSSRLNRKELAKHVHRPSFKYVVYSAADAVGTVPSKNTAALLHVVDNMDIEDDPYVVAMRTQLAKMPPGSPRNRVDQRLSKTLVKKDTFTHKGLRDFARAATEICFELGPWAADWYVAKVLEQAKTIANQHAGVMASWQPPEKKYLLSIISQVNVAHPSGEPQAIMAGLSPKVEALLKCLKDEERSFRTQEEAYSGIIFVTRRDSVLALGELLSRLPELTQHFQIGRLLGNSSTFKRHSFLDITRALLKETSSKTLQDFRIGDKNLLVSTAVAEEGLDIQACGSVIRFDPPPNMVAWVQSRGRARRQRSSFVLMLDENAMAQSKFMKWEQMEKDMMNQYNDTSRDDQEPESHEPEDDIQFPIESTGAVLTLDSAIAHLHHFCAVLPHNGHTSQMPLFDLDPPDFVEGWHSLDPRPSVRPCDPGARPYEGPWGATCTLPRQLPPHLRTFSVDCVYSTKTSARNHVAFFAYVALYDAGLLNDNLLPLISVVRPDEDGEVEVLLKEIEQRAGTANVPIQMDPWRDYQQVAEKWWYSQVTIEGLPALHMYTRCELPFLSEDEQPVLYIRDRGAVTVSICSASVEVDDEGAIAAAQQYTRRMFAPLYEQRMDAAKLDFCYLFLPIEEGEEELVWRERRQWMQERIQRSESTRMETPERSNADAFGKRFAYPLNIASVRYIERINKPLRFIGWHDGPISSEEAEELQARYDGFADFELSFPLLIAQAIPRRVNFLAPRDKKPDRELPILFHPMYSLVDFVSADDVQFASLLPSLLRFTTIACIVRSMRQSLLSSSSLRDIPFSLLRTALTAPVSQEPTNYQRLETLGDTVLKYIVSVQLFSQYPLWHEGYLSKRKDHAVNNNCLAKEAIRLGLEKWIIRDQFAPRKWRPLYSSDPFVPAKGSRTKKENPQQSTNGEGEQIAEGDEQGMQGVDADGDALNNKSPTQQRPKKRAPRTQELSTKMLADVVESLIGAAFEHGGFDLAIECAKLFDMGLPNWEKIPARVEVAFSRVEPIEDLPPQSTLVEQMLGYTFSRKALLVEALTHASYTGNIQTSSYERLEFLGDSALDMIVTDYLYHAPGKDYAPGHMHIRKEALVNSHLLGFICVNTSMMLEATMPSWDAEAGIRINNDSQRIHLFQCLLHSSSRVLEDQNLTLARYEKSGAQIQAALETDTIYPWAALTSLQAPKFIGDMVESLLGAVYLDSHGNLDAVRNVLRTLGIISLMERIVADEVDVLHPVSRLGIWASKPDNNLKLEIKMEKADDNISCIISIDGVEEFRDTQKFRGKTSYNEVRFTAAEGAIRKLKVIETEQPADVDEADWGDVPDYD
ncbi:hypothetical protein EW026_g3818 [Hermanssonia centrifuga]|uniref:Dicer-like protein 2 n=1 Tax=Hermanssonia centrifuga TaxID=98765 RepID=A0A4S4KJ16_9APHY|nr:hypothetical protein EW026_g3818 [Hermanssonia centrifuga]